MQDKKSFGAYLLKKRKEANLTQEELAAKLYVIPTTISKWERGRNMPDLSLFKALCENLDITINDLLSGEKIKKEEYQEKLEENIVNTIDYTNKKMESKNNFIGLILIIFGVLISLTAIAIFPSESSWGSIYSIFGCIVSFIGVSRFTKRLTHIKKLVYNFSYLLSFLIVLIIIDYIGVVNIHQAPRFSVLKISGEDFIYYDTPFYDVIRCNVNQKNETYKVIKNQKYNDNTIEINCK